MKSIILLSAVFLMGFGLLLYAILTDYNGLASNCSGGLSECVTACDTDSIIGGGWCVIKCSVHNGICLISSVIK